MRQIKTIIDKTPEGFEDQVKAAFQEISSEHFREVCTMMNNPTEPDYLYGPFIAILIYDLPTILQSIMGQFIERIFDSTPIINRSVHEMS